MGFKISWIGIHGLSKEEALGKGGLRDTGRDDAYNETAFSGAEFPDSCYILFFNDFLYVEPERLANLSKDCRVVAGQVHEGIMVSTAYCFEDGASVWEIVHNAQNGLYDLEVEGTPPPAFLDIRQRLMEQQVESDAGPGGVDYIFDIPVETAVSLCGFRYGGTRSEWGEPKFTALE